MSDRASVANVRTPAPTFWIGRRVLLTGHTGFIGGWTARWLRLLGARTVGLSLPPGTEPSFYRAADVARAVESRFGDIRRPDIVAAAVEAARPDVVLHLAAQPLVRRAYREPIETIETNVMGTAHLLEACRALAPAPAVIVFTTDKVYENSDAGRPFGEGDPLGGKEPYGAGKAAADILARAYRHSFFADSGIACVRAGNVIGGGDWSEDRLIPDAIRAFAAGEPLVLRNPESVRPWQHVLESVRGLLLLAERLATGAPTPAGLNFGPDPADRSCVGAVARQAAALWGPDALVETRRETGAPYESRLLTLASDAAAETLDWRPAIPLADALALTIEWHRVHDDRQDMAAFTDRQIEWAYRLSAEQERTPNAAHID